MLCEVSGWEINETDSERRRPHYFGEQVDRGKLEFRDVFSFSDAFDSVFI